MAKAISSPRILATAKPQTKHQRVRERLRQQILNGQYPPGSRLPPETELPKRFRVSKLTLVRALNDLVREGVIVRRRGAGSFVADRRHRPLLPGRHLRVAVLRSHSILQEFPIGPFQARMLEGVLAAWGLQVVVPEYAPYRPGDATRATWASSVHGLTVECLGEGEGRPRHPPFEAVRAGRFDGLITLSILEEPFLEQVLGLGLPAVITDFPNDRFALRADQVYLDPLPGYREAIKQFASKGLSRIYFVGGWTLRPLPSGGPARDPDPFAPGKGRVDPDSYVRLSAYRQSMDECGLKTRDDWIRYTWSHGLGCEALAMEWIQRPEAERPEAVICHNLAQGEIIRDTFAAHGLQIHSAGATSTAASLAAGPSLSIHADGYQLGTTAAALLGWRLQEPGRPSLRVGVPMSCQVPGNKEVSMASVP